ARVCAGPWSSDTSGRRTVQGLMTAGRSVADLHTLIVGPAGPASKGRGRPAQAGGKGAFRDRHADTQPGRPHAPPHIAATAATPPRPPPAPHAALAVPTALAADSAPPDGGGQAFLPAQRKPRAKCSGFRARRATGAARRAGTLSEGTDA